MDREEKYLEIWKRSRDSVEHFDRILTEFRKTLITVNGAALPILVSLFLSPLPDKKLYIVLFSFALNLVDFVFWLVEKHYHIYLLVSANVSKKTEELLGIQKEICLTKCLAEEKLQIPLMHSVISFYDFIYIFPATLSLAIPFLTPSFKFRLSATLVFLIELVCGCYIVSKNKKAEQKMLEGSNKEA